MATRQMLSRATEGTQAPTPGYLYKDLTVAAQTNPTVCQEMAQYLVLRLQKTNPNIKYKALKLIAKVADQVPHFKRCLSQSPHGVAEIKAHIGYRGPLDPVRGDEPNQKIRQAAQEALDAVYREAPTSSSAGGMASPYYGGPASGGPSSLAGSRRMDGVGNPRYSDPRMDPRYNGTQPTTIGEAVKEAGEVVLGMIKDPLARNMELPPSVGGVPSRGFGELPQYNHHRAASAPPGAAELSRQTQGQWTMASNRGPNAVAPPPNGAGPASYRREAEPYYAGGGAGAGHQTRASSGAVGGSWANAAAPPMAGSVGGGARSAAGAPSGIVHGATHSSAPASSPGIPASAADGSYERNLIMELCPPSGLKAVPPPDKLAHFSKLVPSLNPDFVCPALLDCLEEGQPWIIRAKALCVMETTLYGGMQGNGTNPYRDFFHACQDEILPMAGHPRAAISGPAKRVLALLGVDGGAVDAAVSGGGGHGREPPLAAASAAPNLLDFDDDAPAPAPAGPPAGAVAVNGGGDGSMFGGMQLKSSAPAGAPSLPPTPGVDFGAGMQVKSVAPAPPSAPSLLDDFGSGPTSEAPSQSIFRPSEASTTASMFDQMTLKSTQEDKKTDSEDAGDLAAPHGAVNGGSAFGFINSASSKDSSAPGATATPFDHPATAASGAVPPPPSAESFDPLKNFSPNSSKKSMTLSPEQMQAMAYQQMMMQQQQIHLQRMMMQQQGMVFPAGMPGVVGGMPVMPGVGGVLPGMPPMAASVGAGGGQSMAGLFKPPSGSTGAPQAKKDDRKFDFVKDAMHTAGKK